jgi:hypothetical protein
MDVAPNRDWSWSISPVAERLMYRAARLEAAGQVREALRQYEALLRLDRLLRRYAPPFDPLRGGSNESLAAGVWGARHLRAEPSQIGGFPNSRHKQDEWGTRAFGSFRQFAAEHGRADLVAVAREARETQARAWLGRCEESRLGFEFSGNMNGASILWRTQLMALGAIGVTLLGLAAYGSLARQSCSEPTSVELHLATAAWVALINLLASLCLACLRPPSPFWVFMPHTLASSIWEGALRLGPWVVPLALGPCAWGLLRRLACTDPRRIELAMGKVVSEGRKLLGVFLFLYLFMACWEISLEAGVTRSLP